ncbi:histidine--tRNA ligase [Minwuia sp.]|uniref:histidine--tRNA ligase n=1 Tax=Minwuia sp. TaxID=2493630 RepID=UPI003A8D70C5
MAKVQPVRGTHDLLADDFAGQRAVIDVARRVALTHGYREIATPIFEFTEVFARSMGETSDVVSKEMYTFEDRGGESITLRPEYTAAICRAFISNGLQQSVPFKAFAAGPMFRYERPQKGRLRQFHQIDLEVIGAPEPAADVEVISAGAEILNQLNVLHKTVLHINTLGDPESRDAYRTALVDYFGAHRDRLSEDSLARLDRNPLRILDSKDEGDRALVVDAPLFSDYLNQHSQDFFGDVLAGLDTLGIGYEIDPRLVRGLDYYTHTAFEFVTDALGAQGAVIAGGRYDGLIEQIGGPPTPGIGWAGGIERLAMLSGVSTPAPRPIVLVPVGEAAEYEASKWAQWLRRKGFVVELGFKGNVGKRMKRADRIGAACAILLGDDELERDVVNLKDLHTGEQREVTVADLEDALAAYEGSRV